MKRGRKRKEKPLEDGEGVLGELLPKAHPVEIEAQSTRQCSGALLRTREPTIYEEVVKCLAAGFTVRNIMKMFGLGTHTVLAIARIEKLNVATLKARFADMLLLGANVFGERAIELAASCDSAFEAAGTMKHLFEMSQLARGQATSITEERVIQVDANKLASDMAREAQEMGFPGGEKSPMAGFTPPLALDAASSDIKSAVFCVVTPICDSICADSASASALNFRGEGGVPS